jgi:hypothetical protein
MQYDLVIMCQHKRNKPQQKMISLCNKTLSIYINITSVRFENWQKHKNSKTVVSSELLTYNDLKDIYLEFHIKEMLRQILPCSKPLISGMSPPWGISKHIDLAIELDNVFKKHSHAANPIQPTDCATGTCCTMNIGEGFVKIVIAI